MFRLYTILKERQDWKDGTITEEEIDIASGKTSLDSSMTADFVKLLDQRTENIRKAFTQQEYKSLVRNLILISSPIYLQKFTLYRAHGIRKSLSDF